MALEIARGVSLDMEFWVWVWFGSMNTRHDEMSRSGGARTNRSWQTRWAGCNETRYPGPCWTATSVPPMWSRVAFDSYRQLYYTSWVLALSPVGVACLHHHGGGADTAARCVPCSPPRALLSSTSNSSRAACRPMFTASFERVWFPPPSPYRTSPTSATPMAANCARI